MPDTTTTETTTSQPVPFPTFADSLRHPAVLVARRAELLTLATERAAQFTAVARARLEKATQGASVTVRTAAHDQLQRAATALQELAKKIEPSQPQPQVPAEKPPTNGVK